VTSGNDSLRPQTAEERRERARRDRERREAALQNSVPFISPNAGFSLGRGFNLICGQSGQSKSTTSANIVAGAVEYTKGNILVMSNEETSSAVYDRVACILTHTPFQKFYHRRLTGQQLTAVEKAADLVADRVEVLDFESHLSMGVVEDVERVLSWAPKHYSLIVLDYVQNVNASREDPQATSWDISKRLGRFLKDLSQELTNPLVVFAQLKPKSHSEDISDRIQNDKTLFNHALLCVEIVPDFETRETTFKIHKDRFGPMQGKEVNMRFREGWYECGEDII
jgi:hypothetical protein